MTENSKRRGPILGVDIGGTKVAVGLVDLDGKILTQGRKPMVANGTAEAALQAVTGAIDFLSSSAAGGIHSIGICAPGPLDPKTGVVLNPPNLPCWRNFPLAEKIVAMYHVPVKVDNYANAAALAGLLEPVETDVAVADPPFPPLPGLPEPPAPPAADNPRKSTATARNGPLESAA